MNKQDSVVGQLELEITDLRRRISRLESLEIEYRKSESEWHETKIEMERQISIRTGRLALLSQMLNREIAMRRMRKQNEDITDTIEENEKGIIT